MHKLIFPFLILFLPFTLIAQCKYEKNEIDEFTDKIHVLSKEERFVSIGSFNANIQLSMYDHSTNVVIQTYDRKIDCYDLDTKIYFKFKNGEVVILQNKLDLKVNKTSTVRSENGEILEVERKVNTNCEKDKRFKSSLSPEEFEILKNQELVKIRVSANDEAFDYEVKKKYRFKISKMANCIELAFKQLKQ